MYSFVNYCGFNGKILDKIVLMPSWNLELAHQGKNMLAVANLIL